MHDIRINEHISDKKQTQTAPPPKYASPFISNISMSSELPYSLGHCICMRGITVKHNQFSSYKHYERFIALVVQLTLSFSELKIQDKTMRRN